MRPLLTLTVLSFLAACAEFPDVDQAVSDSAKRAPFPDLIPVDDILIEDAARLDEHSDDQLIARVDRLNRRANELRTRPIE
ncbi:hypothetical protein [Shimia thalassica]|uniref:hypothetical protein n=1 Tax=Shimia thalassica TaxID=1715693 RepID=UPI0026E442A2|nr:hypothetical protein [Shimia thalassica]MDO6485546.1 hypothetical protein [Shimia thalassica]